MGVDGYWVMGVGCWELGDGCWVLMVRSLVGCLVR